MLVAALAIIALGAYAAFSYAGALSGNTSSSGLRINPQDPVLGSRSAPVTIYEFGEFQCPSCKFWYSTQEQVIVQNLIQTGKAKLVWKDFDFYGPDSISASQAAHAAADQGRFWDFYTVLWTNQGAINSGWADKDHLRGFAQQIGLNMTQFDQAFRSGKYDSLIDENYNTGKQLGVTGTPTFFVVGPAGKTVQLFGPQPFSAFQQAVDSVSRG